MQDLCPTKAMPTHHFSPRWTLRFLASMAGLVLAGAAQAELADKDKPMNIEADSLRYEDTRQTSVFTGNVLITKGTIVMRGSKIDVRQDPQGNQIPYNSLTEVFTVKGGPANRPAANPSGRVRAMLTPIPEAETAPAPAATDPAQLRPSTNLNEKKK